jgi:hypothetical protein
MIHTHAAAGKDLNLSFKRNKIAEEMFKAIATRSDQLMENLALASAVYIDPRMNHKTSSKKLLGGLKNQLEVR